MTVVAPVRVLLLGGSGQVGRSVQELAPHTWTLHAPASSELSLTDLQSMTHALERAAPHVIINSAAYTRVDDAESDEHSAYRLNAEAPALLAEWSRRAGTRLIHISTDYVFDGTAAPYRVDAPTAPINAYGRTKREGERLVMAADPGALIIRTSWVHAGYGTNFIATATRLLANGTSMRVVDDQISAPTRAHTVAQAIIRFAQMAFAAGVEHVTDGGVASWYDVACCVAETLRHEGLLAEGVGVTPVSSDAFPRPARRPALSLLDTHSTRARLGWTPPHWREGVIQSTTEWLAQLRGAGSAHV